MSDAPAQQPATGTPAEKSYRIERFTGDPTEMHQIATLHRQIRQGQVDAGLNTFADIDDSQKDLHDIHRQYGEPGGFWVARTTETTGEIIGFVGLKDTGTRDGEIKRFAVAEHARGCGIGTALIAALMAWARPWFDILSLSTGFQENARHIYERAGFRWYYDDLAHQDHLMLCDLYTARLTQGTPTVEWEQLLHELNGAYRLGLSATAGEIRTITEMLEQTHAPAEIEQFAGTFTARGADLVRYHFNRRNRTKARAIARVFDA